MAFFSSTHIFMVGIKGSGMSSLALYLHTINAKVSGWDVDEVFTTDSELIKNSIPFSHTIPSRNSLSLVDYLIYSSAYTKNHPIISLAKEMGIPLYSYVEALAQLTTHSPSFGVSGTHGKTTSVLSLHHMLTRLSIPHSAICGSSVIEELEAEMIDISDSSPLILEACEYQDHFLNLHLKGLFITNVEYEHVDYFTDEEQLFSSFFSLIDNLPPHAPIICNRDERGIERIIKYVEEQRNDITLITYGKKDGNTITYSYPFRQSIYSLFIHQLDSEYTSQVVGEKLISDQFGAALLAMMIIKERVDLLFLGELLNTLETFKGAKGRVQMIDTDSLPFFLYNDYAHHPSEIRSSLHTIRLLHPESAIILLFLPHTVSRMRALYDDFVSALSLCDTLCVFPVATSARLDGTQREAIEISTHLAHDCNGFYVENEMEAINFVSTVLHSKDVCITMGAGNTLILIDLLLAIKELPV